MNFGEKWEKHGKSAKFQLPYRNTSPAWRDTSAAYRNTPLPEGFIWPSGCTIPPPERYPPAPYFIT
jgi:hypothetical protein